MSYTDEDLANIRVRALRDGMHEIHLRGPNHWCTCGWATLIETRDIGAGWSGTWCNGCSLREEIERLRFLITEWADAGADQAQALVEGHDDDIEVLRRYNDASDALRKAVGR